MARKVMDCCGGVAGRRGWGYGSPMGGLPIYPPMLAELGRLPADDDAYAYEMKWDGVRAVAYLRDGPLRLLSRNAKDFTVAYPELAGLADTVTEPTVLDGEIIALGPKGRPSFEALQPRMHLRQPGRIAQLADKNPVTYMIFDLLHVGDQPIISLPYTERRSRLEDLGLAGPRWAVPDAFRGGGPHAYEQSKELGLEGVVAKRLNSRYLPGRRDRSWTKVKNFRTQEVIILGWTPGEGRRAGRIGALLLGIHAPDGELVYSGKVGTGFTEKILDDLAETLAALEQDEPPAEVPRADAHGAHWVKPQQVGEVSYAEWTDDARLRHPSWRGLRPDKNPEDVYREQ